MDKTSDVIQSSDTVGVDTNHQKQPPQAPEPTSTSATTESAANQPAPPEPVNGPNKPHEDDAGDVVLEDKEDTVIY